MEVLKYVEGSFIPSLDGASNRFRQAAKSLPDAGVGIQIIHCNRGWSDLNEISQQRFRTYAISPSYFYQDHSVAEKIIKNRRPDIVEMDSMEQLLSGGVHISKKFKIPLVFEVHFVSSVLMSDLNADDQAIDGKKNQEWELKDVISGAVCFTDLDRRNFLNATNLDPQRVKVVPIGSDTESIKQRDVQDGDHNILFLGNMYFEPNAQAVEYTVDQIVPAVLEHHPEVVFKFIGDVPDSLKSKYQSEKVLFTGRVEDINEVFDGSRICIAPIQTGGGMRVKVLTYMASGIPTVTTTIGAEGIVDTSALKIGDNTHDFISHVNRLLDSKESSVSLGRKARELAEQVYSWKTIATKCREFYKEVVANPIIPKIYPRPIVDEPFWLTETIQKGRFKRNNLDRDTVEILGFGETNKMRVEEFVK